MENEVKEMCKEYVVPESVLNSDKLHDYFVEAVSQFKKAMYRELYTLDSKQIAALLKLKDEQFTYRSVFDSPYFFLGEFVVMHKMAQTLLLRKLERFLSDN